MQIEFSWVLVTNYLRRLSLPWPDQFFPRNPLNLFMKFLKSTILFFLYLYKYLFFFSCTDFSRKLISFQFFSSSNLFYLYVLALQLFKIDLKKNCFVHFFVLLALIILIMYLSNKQQHKLFTINKLHKYNAVQLEQRFSCEIYF